MNLPVIVDKDIAVPGTTAVRGLVFDFSGYCFGVVSGIAVVPII